MISWENEEKSQIDDFFLKGNIRSVKIESLADDNFHMRIERSRKTDIVIEFRSLYKITATIEED